MPLELGFASARATAAIGRLLEFQADAMLGSSLETIRMNWHPKGVSWHGNQRTELVAAPAAHATEKLRTRLPVALLSLSFADTRMCLAHIRGSDGAERFISLAQVQANSPADRMLALHDGWRVVWEAQAGNVTSGEAGGADRAPLPSLADLMSKFAAAAEGSSGSKDSARGVFHEEAVAFHLATPHAAQDEQLSAADQLSRVDHGSPHFDSYLGSLGQVTPQQPSALRLSRCGQMAVATVVTGDDQHDLQRYVAGQNSFAV